MSTNNGLKICTFNAKCDDLDYKCCIKKSYCADECGDMDHTSFPDSLVATMIAIAILPHKADVYNIQNVKNECVVKHLVKEICRVKSITDKFSNIDYLSRPSIAQEFLTAACELSTLTGLCKDGAMVRDALLQCNKYKLNYLGDMTNLYLEDRRDEFMRVVLMYTGISNYDAYFNGTSLTLVKKELCICPEVKIIPGVESIVLFFEYNNKRFINPNVNLGDMGFSLEELGCKKDLVDRLTCFLAEYKDCGAVVMTGVLGDLDYDTPQLLFKGDALIPEVLQRLSAKNSFDNIVPSDFPTDLDDNIYGLLEYFLKTCNAEHIPYSWLLQYLRLKGCQKCCLYNLVCKDKSRCDDLCPPVSVTEITDCMKGCSKPYQPVIVPCNRSAMRRKMKKCDKTSNINVCCDAPKRPCPPKKTKCGECRERVCEDVCKASDCCKVPLRECEDCNSETCEIVFKEPYQCPCKDSKYLVDVDVCEDLCKKKACCDSCAHGGECEGDKNVCCDESDKCVKFCDPVSVLKRECCLYNAMDKVTDVNDRFTGFHDHFNRCLDCKFPKGIFQAWATCQKYEVPRKPSRMVDNNSELLALDHILVSECLKGDITEAKLSELCFEKCGVPFSPEVLASTSGKLNAYPTIAKLPFKVGGRGVPIQSLVDKVGSVDGAEELVDLVVTPDYSGAVLKSFFTHRVFCININCPHPVGKECKVSCAESLHSLGLTGLWSALCRFGKKTVCVDDFAAVCLDKHPFFCDLFYDKVTSKFQRKDAKTRFLKAFDACVPNNVLAYCLKKECLCEEEFYSHLLDIYACTENKEKFIITIGFMEAVVKYIKINKLEDSVIGSGSDAGSQSEYDIVKDGIEKLFFYLDNCFSGSVKVALLLSLLSGLQGSECGIVNTVINGIVNLATDGNSNGSEAEGDLFADLSTLSTLIANLNDYIYTNCAVMNILIEQVCRAIDTTGIYSEVLTTLVMKNGGQITEDDIEEGFLELTDLVIGNVPFLDDDKRDEIYELYYNLARGSGNCRDFVCKLLEYIEPSAALQTVMALAAQDMKTNVDEWKESQNNA